MQIPKIIHIVWIGSEPAPAKWINTWKVHNPDWEFSYWDNERVFGRTWQNQEMIDFYLEKTKDNSFKLANGGTMHHERAKYFQWHVIADIIRYEILYEYGGYMPGADSECLRSINDKFGDEAIYTVNTGHLYTNYLKNEFNPIRIRRYLPENASPILASVPSHPFLKLCIEELPKREWGEAVDTTGNVFMGDMIRKYGVPDDMRIDPYIKKADRVNPHSIHHAGTTTSSYKHGR